MNGPRIDLALPGALVITCEHGGNRIPSAYRALFSDNGRLLASHHAYDKGALQVARALSREFRAPLVAATTSRLLVDLNRSVTHPRLFGEAVRELPLEERSRILKRHYFPHRNAVEREILKRSRTKRPVLHLAVHSFTPVLNGEVRNADLGLLYDPRRHGERRLCAQAVAVLKAVDPGFKVRCNYPYLGKSDGLTTALRKRFPADTYIGIELELNQRLANTAGLRRISRALTEVFVALKLTLRGT